MAHEKQPITDDIYLSVIAKMIDSGELVLTNNQQCTFCGYPGSVVRPVGEEYPVGLYTCPKCLIEKAECLVGN